jgi:glutamate/tyrosine decarboxylase-like PLP-dependent enzyme
VLHLSDKFIAPDGSNRSIVDSAFSIVAREVTQFLSTAAGNPTLPAQDGWVPDVTLPASGRSIDTLTDDLRQIFKRSMNPASPGFIGHMDTMPATAGIAGEFAAAALNNNMLSVEMSPLFSHLERTMTLEVCRWFGLGKHAGGLMLSGGSLANLQALAVVRNHVLDCHRFGVLAAGQRAVVFASAVAHTSLHKACMLLGLGIDAVIAVDVDSDSRILVDDLEAKVLRARAEGAVPLCVVATAGTTTTGSIDPLRQIAVICQRESLWLHVDAAYGGALVLSVKHRQLLDGIEQADSITFNPQKWLYVPKTCAMVLFRDERIWHKAFRVSSPYMHDTGSLINQTEISVQGTRHAEVLKLWMTLQHLGQSTIEELISHSMALAQKFANELRKRRAIEVVLQPQTNIVCFRVSKVSSDADRSEMTNRLYTRLVRSGRVFMSLPTYSGEKVIRAVLLNPYLDDVVLGSVIKQIDAALLESN